MRMKPIFLGALGAAIAWAPAAHALVMNTYPVDSIPPLTGEFIATAGPGGVITGTIGVTHTFADSFIDDFTFTVADDGSGTGTISTGTTRLNISPDLDFTSITFNGTNIPITRSPSNALDFIELASVANLPITAGVLNHLIVSGVSTNPSSYAGTLTFTPTAAVPEPATWALMIIGFGATGMRLRLRKPKSVRELVAA